MGFLEWLGQLLASFIPPWELVPKTHTGVRQRNMPIPAVVKTWCDRQRRDGRRFLGFMHYAPEHCVYIRDCGSGFALKIPFIDEIWQLPTTLESEDLLDLKAETKDGTVYELSPVLTWKVANTTKACFDVSNYEESLKNAVRSIIVRWVNSWEGPLNVTVMEKEVSALVRAMGAEWGCFTKGLSFNSCSCAWQRYELMHQFVEPNKRGGDAQVQEG